MKDLIVGLIIAAVFIAPTANVYAANQGTNPAYFTCKDVGGQYDMFMYLQTAPDEGGTGKAKWMYIKMRCRGYSFWPTGWFMAEVHDVSDASLETGGGDIGSTARGTFTINGNGLVKFVGTRDDGEPFQLTGRMNLGKDTISGVFDISADIGIYNAVKRLN